MIIYDLEICKCILGKNEKPQEGVEYVKGWHDHENMGVSVVSCFDYESGRYRVFCEDNLKEFLALVDAHDIIVSFNGIGFDNKVLAYALSRPDTSPVLIMEHLNLKSYDIFAEIRDISSKWCSLDSTIKANDLGAGKSDNGALAPAWYQAGQWGRLIDYCVEDVRLTKMLLDMIIGGKPIINPKNGQPMVLRKPIKEEGEK